MNSTPPLPQHAFRLLSRQYNLTPWSDQTLATSLDTTRRERQNALVEIELQGGLLGRLLLQAGRVVYAQQGEQQGRAALATIEQQGAHRRSRVVRLDVEQATLAYAAVDGTPCATDEFRGLSLGTYLRELTRRAFEGVLAVEHGRQLTIVCFSQGRKTDPAPLETLRVTRLTQIAWQQRSLDELKGLADEQVASPPTATSAEAASNLPPSSQTTPPEVVVLPSREALEHDPERVWALFATAMDGQLGDRAARLVATTRTSLVSRQGAEPLTVQLARQVERVAGNAAAHDFLARCALASPPQPGRAD